MTLFDTALSLLVPHAANWMYSGEVPGLLGSAHPNIAPYDKFQCQDGLVFLGILNDRQFAKFCTVMDLPQLIDDPRFATNAARLQHREDLQQQIEAALSGWQRESVCSALMRSGVPVGPVHTVLEAFSQPHAVHRGMQVSIDGYRGIGVPVRLSQTPGRPTGGPPRFGQHAREVLDESGLDEGQINHLQEIGVCPDAVP